MFLKLNYGCKARLSATEAHVIMLPDCVLLLYYELFFRLMGRMRCCVYHIRHLRTYKMEFVELCMCGGACAFGRHKRRCGGLACYFFEPQRHKGFGGKYGGACAFGR